jgi:hypothetical protein
MNKLYEWGFSKEEKSPVPFIGVMAMIIVMSSAISVFWIYIIHRLELL